MQDEAVRYLKLRRYQGVKLPIGPTGKVGKDVDFTVMLWFKLYSELKSDTASDTDIMYLFSFPNSLRCHLASVGTLTCECANLPKLRLMNLSDILKPNKWFHLTVSGTAKNGGAYLQLSDNEHGRLAFD